MGRDPERAAIRVFLDALVAGHGRELTIAGAAGMGKTTLWEDALAHAGRHGVRVLDARPTPAEAGLAFAGLHELLRDVDEAAIDAIPAPQRRALDAALYRDDAPGEVLDDAPPPEAGAIAVAMLSLLRALAASGPLLVAIDDVQWLDPSSRAPLRFAIRRLQGAPVGALVTLRVEDDGDGVDDGWTTTDDPATRIELGPLSLGALHRLIVDRSGHSLARPSLVRLLERTGGNPFLATELVAAWGPEAAARASSGRPLPETVARLVRQRVVRLGIDARRVAQVVALLGRTREEVVARVLAPDGVTAVAVRDATLHAIEAGVLRVDGDRVRCAHAIIASSLVSSLSPGTVRELHARIAVELDDPIEVAIHSAEAVAGPDASIAERLDAAATVAIHRGASLESVALRERALALTEPEDVAALARRRFALADALFTAGDTEAAREHLREVLLDDPAVEAVTRRETLLLLATIAWFDSGQGQAVALGEQALAVSPDDIAWQAKANARLSWVIDDDLSRQAAYAAEALRLLDPEDDPVTYAFAALNGAWARLLAGEGADDAAITLGDRLQEAARSWEYSTVPAAWAKAMDRFDEARALIDRYLDHSRERGDESSVAQLLSMRVEVEAWTGRLVLAQELADASVAAAEQSGQQVYLSTSLARRAMVRAYAGDLEEAETDARASLDIAIPPLMPPLALGVLGSIALAQGRPADAVGHLAAADAMLASAGMRDPAPYRFHGDLVEALILTGDVESADRQVSLLDERARVAPRPWVTAIAARCRALVAAARGDVPGALSSFERALEAHAALDMPFELARTQLAHGLALRRSGSRRRAAAAIGMAVEGFRVLGSRPWVARAEGELARVGLQPRDDGGLSPSEQRIARLAADGLTNRVIAERLVISPKTVEATLARVYIKLGIGSRAQLGARMAAGASDGEAGEPAGR